MAYTVTVTWIQQETVEMPQLQFIDEVVEVPGPLKEAVSIPVEALMSEALGDGEGTADLRERRDVRRGAKNRNWRAGCPQAVVDTIGREETRQYRAC